MRTEEEITKMKDLMEQTYETGSDLSCVESPADAYNSYETLKWVLGEPSLIEELLSHAGVTL